MRTCQHLRSHVRPLCTAQAVRSATTNAIVVASSCSIQDSRGIIRSQDPSVIFRSQDHSSVAVIHPSIHSLTTCCRSLRSLHPHKHTHTPHVGIGESCAKRDPHTHTLTAGSSGSQTSSAGQQQRRNGASAAVRAKCICSCEMRASVSTTSLVMLASYDDRN